MIVIGLDPGPEQSAYVIYNGATIMEHDIVENAVMRTRLETWKDDEYRKNFQLVIEQISMGGQIAGPSIFETCFWSGRFAEMWEPRRWDRVRRVDVKLQIAGFMRATDKHIREALVERFGPGEQKALGKRKTPGPLYGISSHKWAALAVAVTWYDANGHLNRTV